MRLRLTLLAGLLLSGCDAPVSAEQGKNHGVQPGETLFSIAERAYGNGLEWPRIWEANPHLDPDRLRRGEIIYIPPRDEMLADPAPTLESYANPPPQRQGTMVHGNPAPRSPSSSPGMVLQNLQRTVTERTLFGFSLEKAFLALILCFLLHAFLQTVLVWIAANLTFVKEVTFKKSAKAVVMTETLTLTTVSVTLIVGILLIYLGSEPAVGPASGPLFPTLEGYLSTPTGAVLGGMAVLGLYITLSLRFLPQVFSLQTSHAIALMTIAILVPHLVGFYLVGQRAGLIR